MFKGLVRVCIGIWSPNAMSFEDHEVSPSVSLKRLTRQHQSGLRFIAPGDDVTIESNHEMRVRKIMCIKGVLRNKGTLIMD